MGEVPLLEELVRYGTPSSGVVGQVITLAMYSSMMAWQTSLTMNDWVLWGTLHPYFMAEYLLPEAR